MAALTLITVCHRDFLKGSYGERNLRFGVREHAMAAICNGMHAYGGYLLLSRGVLISLSLIVVP